MLWMEQKKNPQTPKLGISCNLCFPQHLRSGKQPQNFRGKVCPVPCNPMQTWPQHHPLLFLSLSCSSPTGTSFSLLSLPQQIFLLNPASATPTRHKPGSKISGRLRSGGGCWDSLAAVAVTGTALLSAAIPQKVPQPVLGHPIKCWVGITGHSMRRLPTPRSSA